jgi:putative ATP-binding cassette transporter
MRLFKHPIWSRFVTMAYPFFVLEARSKAIGALIVLVVLLLTINGMNIAISYATRDFMTALEQRHPEQFYRYATLLAGVFAAATISEAFSYYTEQRLGLLRREWLTRRLLDRYLAGRAFHRLTGNQAIDNPDERISEDAKTFTTSSLSFVVLIINAVLTLVAFLGVSWSITPWLVLTAVVYSALGSLGTILVGRRLVPLNNWQLQKEADFRFGLGRVREHAGSVAQLSGQSGEKSRLLARLQSLVENFRAIISVTRNVGFFTRGYNYLIQIIPIAVVAPLYIRGQVEFGTVPQAAMAFSQIVGAFSLIVTRFQEISTYAAVTDRLGAMWEATEPAGGRPAAAPASGAKEATPVAHIERAEDEHRIAYQGLTLWTPKEKRLLVRNLSLEVTEGCRLIVTGPNRSGKTALCLAMAGLWGAGSGKIVCPTPEQIMFLPQRLYSSTGRLRDLLVYGLDRTDLSDQQLRAALDQVGLGDLEREVGGLDAAWDWSNDLSAVDQHALAVARILLARPRFAVLDGVPWALESSRLEHLYQALERTSITYISLGGGIELSPYHQLWLQLYGEGCWRLRRTHEPRETIASEDGRAPSAGEHQQASEKAAAGSRG